MEDIYYNVFTFLNVKDILKCSLVNKLFWNIYHDQTIWKNLIECNFKDIEFFKVNWYKTYKFCYFLNGIAKRMSYHENYNNINKIYEAHHLHNWMLNNNYSKIPKTLGYLSNLTFISFNGRPYNTIPTEIYNLINLSTLYLSSTKMNTIPTEIGKLHNLEELSLSDNLIKIIPTEFGNLINLKGLWLHTNPINILPTEFGHLSNLELLHIYNTNIGILPTELIQLNKLTDIRVNKHLLMTPGFRRGVISKY
jgi:hypothetical protein